MKGSLLRKVGSNVFTGTCCAANRTKRIQCANRAAPQSLQDYATLRRDMRGTPMARRCRCRIHTSRLLHSAAMTSAVACVCFGAGCRDCWSALMLREGVGYSRLFGGVSACGHLVELPLRRRVDSITARKLSAQLLEREKLKLPNSLSSDVEEICYLLKRV